MRKIKDFFYDKNDIIIVLLILAAAGFIIYTRIDVIMDYPETFAKQAVSATQEAGAGQESEQTNSTDTEATTAAVTTVTIEDDDTSITVSKKLERAKLISSATEFESFISNSGKASDIKTGIFQIPSGSSDEEILDIITK